MTSAAALKALLRCAASYVSRHDSEIAREIAGALIAVQAAEPELPPAMAAASESVPQMLEGSEDELLVALRSCVHALHWRAAGFGNLPDSASESLAVTELIGPDGMFPASAIRVGLLIQHPCFHYPKHSHAAEELYLVLKGTAHWAIDNDTPVPRPPGTFVHHESFQPHSMVTTAEPLLALWGWTGDVDGATYSV